MAKTEEVSELHSIDVRSSGHTPIYCLSITRNTAGEPRLEVRTAENGSIHTKRLTLFPFKGIADHFARSQQNPYRCHDDDGNPLPFVIQSKHWKRASVEIAPTNEWTVQLCQHG